MTFDSLTLRRRIVRLAHVGENFSITGDFARIESEAVSFCRAKKIPIRIEVTDDGATITRIEAQQRGSERYPGLTKLQPGDSILIEVDPKEHQRVRVYASHLGRKMGAVFRCTKSGEAILVTRIDGTDAEQSPARASKYDLDRLATQREIRFELPPADHHKLRLACSHKARITGWAIRCRLQDDGSMLVYRTDTQDPTQQPVENAAI